MEASIFFHVWMNRSESTHGCVALSEHDMLEILRWLNPAAKPLVVYGKREKMTKGFKDSRVQVERNE